MRIVTIEPASMVYDMVDGAERVTVVSWQALKMVLWANWQLILILMGALVYGLEQPYGFMVRLWLAGSYGLTAFAWALCEPVEAIIIFLMVLLGAVAESVALFGLWIDDNGGW